MSGLVAEMDESAKVLARDGDCQNALYRLCAAE